MQFTSFRSISLAIPTEAQIIQQYRLTRDMHTHTVYSHGLIYAHGKGTILENVRAAAAHGLREIAITDHGPGHKLYGLKQENLPRMREEIARAMELVPGVKVWLGVEANIVNTPNGLDISREDFSQYDLVLAGYHYGTARGHMTANWMTSHRLTPSGSRASLMASNTDMAVRALYENDVMTLTHPCDKGPFDLRALCKACEETHTLMEINTRHRHLTADELRVAMEYDVSFIIDSDAHRPQEVGHFANGVARALSAGLDLTRIVNLEPVPNLR